jgi:Holliday junction resolvasome RuvABC endonuclease subunit
VKAVATALPPIDEIRANPVVQVGSLLPFIEMGFDLSTTAVGWAVSANQSHVARGKLIFNKAAGMGAKVRAFYHFLRDLLSFFKPQRLVLEKPVMRHGSSTARHNEMLAIVRLAAVEVGIGEIDDAFMIPPQTIKRCLKVPKGANYEDNKQQMLKLINQRLGINLKYHKANKTESDDDIADAIAALEAAWVLDQERATPPSAKSGRKKKAKEGK